MMRVRVFSALFVLALAAAIGCQSVATTSAKLRNQEGNYDLALKLCREALATNPNDAEAHFQMGYAYSKLDSVALAYKEFTKAGELDPKKKADADDNIQSNFARHYKLGQAAFNRQDYKVAAQEFEMATLSNPTQSNAFFNLGVAYTRLAEDDSTYHEKALEAADKVLALSNPSDANYTKALQLAGRELVDMNRSDEAVQRFHRLIEEDPSSYDVIQRIGDDLLKEQKWKGASVFLKMAAEARAKVGAEDFDLYYNIGVALYNTRDTDSSAVAEAITYYQKALDLKPDEPTTIFNIEVAYVAMGDWANAATWGEKFVSVSPDDPRGWQLLARIYTETGDKEKAKEAATRYEQIMKQKGQ